MQLISKKPYKTNGTIIPRKHNILGNNGKTIIRTDPGTTSLNQNNINRIFTVNV